MLEIKSYKLDIDTIQTLDDVKVILDGLNLITYSNVDEFDKLKKYFTKEIIPETKEEEISDEELKKEAESWLKSGCSSC